MSHTRIMRLMALCLLISRCHAITLPGTLNQLFGNGGRFAVTVDTPAVYDCVFAVDTTSYNSSFAESAPVSKHIIIGSSEENLLLVSVLSDGTPEAIFGDNGIVIDTRYQISTNATGTGKAAAGVIYNQKLYVAATNDDNGQILLLAYKLNGIPTGTPIEIDLGTPGLARAIAVGNTSTPTIIIASNAGNTPYLSFVTGTTATSVPVALPFDALINDIKVQKDGKIVAAGQADIGGNLRFFVARFLPNGQLDTTFGPLGTGYTTNGLGTNARASSLAIQGDGKIVVTGVNNTPEALVVRYTSAGLLDSTFGTAGLARFDINTSESVRISIQNNGEILINGTITSPAPLRMYAIRFTQAGQPDISFGSSGIQGSTVFQSPVSLGGASASATNIVTLANPSATPTVGPLTLFTPGTSATQVVAQSTVLATGPAVPLPLLAFWGGLPGLGAPIGGAI